MEEIGESQYCLCAQWEKLKTEFPIGHKFYGKVVRIEPFGIFIDLGYQVLNGHKLSGIVDVITQADHDSKGLPLDYSLWPTLGQRVYCKVIAYREEIKEVDLRLVNVARCVQLE